jgi:ligand-binding sensor domain-containing protein/two-component sensor histidine kinase
MGLYIIDPAAASITHVLSDKKDPFALAFNYILSIKEDRKGGIWVGTDGGGISYYNSQFYNFHLVSDKNMPDAIAVDQIRAITTDEEGVLWLGTYGRGLTAYIPSQKKFETFCPRAASASENTFDRILSLMADDAGDLWIGTQGDGLLLLDRKTRKVRKWFKQGAGSAAARIPDNTVTCLLQHTSSQAYVAIRDAGLLLIDKEKGVVKQWLSSAENDPYPADTNIKTILQLNDSTLALGYERGGIKLLHLPSGRFCPIRNELIQHHLGNQTAIKSLYYNKGWLWAGTAGKGILITHLESGNTLTLTEKEGLPNNMIYSLLPEREGVLWASSNKGLFRMEYEERQDHIALIAVTPYTQADGLQSNEYNTGAYHRSREGVLYFGGISGFNYFDPGQIKKTQQSVPVLLTAAMVGNRPLESDTLISYLNSLRLSYQQNSVSFTFTALDFLAAEKHSYQYQLAGYDEDWIDAGDRRYTAYTNLPPGRYVFKVRVAGNAAEEVPSTALAITIARPYWLQWWFIGLLVCVCLLGLYGIYYWRIRALLRVQKVKNNISADLHDDIGSRLTNIQFLSVLSRTRLRGGAEVDTFLSGIEEQVQASSEALDEIVWNIKMADENLEDITAKMRRYAGEVLEMEGIQYEVKIDAGFSRKKLSMQKRRELFLVFKELLNNIRKHARAKQVSIHLSIQERMFCLAIQDDGSGFDPHLPTTRNGLRNIRERLRRWHGSLYIRSKPGVGTLIELRIPFDKSSVFENFRLPAVPALVVEKLRLTHLKR